MQFLPIEIIFNLHPPIREVCSIKFLNSWTLAFFSGHRFHFNLALIPLVGSQTILSQILAIQNSNHTQEHKYLHRKLFLFEGKKITGQTPNNFTIIKSITIILVYASRLRYKLYFPKAAIFFSILLFSLCNTPFFFLSLCGTSFSSCLCSSF